MKTVKILVIVFVVILITSCSTNGLISTNHQKPIPVLAGPMTRSQPNNSGWYGPGSQPRPKAKITFVTIATVPKEKELFKPGQYRRNEPNANGQIRKGSPKKRR